MKYRCFAALALALLLPGCAAAPDLTPVWQRDLPASGVHIELANAALLSDADVYYAATREELYVHNVSVLPAVKTDGQPVVTFYGAAAQDIDLVYLEDIGDVYVDYDRVKPQIKLDYILTEGDGYVSYELDTAYNFEFTVTTQTGEDKILVVSERSDVKCKCPARVGRAGIFCALNAFPFERRWPRPRPRSDEGKVRAISHIRAVTGT